jgi:hypothetical protein
VKFVVVTPPFNEQKQNVWQLWRENMFHLAKQYKNGNIKFALFVVRGELSCPNKHEVFKSQCARASSFRMH